MSEEETKALDATKEEAPATENAVNTEKEKTSTTEVKCEEQKPRRKLKDMFKLPKFKRKEKKAEVTKEETPSQPAAAEPEAAEPVAAEPVAAEPAAVEPAKVEAEKPAE